MEEYVSNIIEFKLWAGIINEPYINLKKSMQGRRKGYTSYDLIFEEECI